MITPKQANIIAGIKHDLRHMMYSDPQYKNEIEEKLKELEAVGEDGYKAHKVLDKWFSCERNLELFITS